MFVALIPSSPRQISMFVIKRDGRKELVHFDKITARITKLCYGLDENYVEPIVVSQKVVQGVYKGVTTSELDELAAETAAHLTTLAATRQAPVAPLAAPTTAPAPAPLSPGVAAAVRRHYHG
jgi:hypothetical protein